MSNRISPKAVSLTFGVLVLLFAVGFYIFAAWTEPSQTPPAGNVSAPLNVGSTAQTKTGNLTLPNLYLNAVGNEGGIYNANIVQGYNDLILYSNSTKNLPIYIEGNPLIINNDAGTGNVGIGVVNPSAKLAVGGAGSFGDAVAAYANSAKSALYAQQSNSSGYAGYFLGRVNISDGTQGTGKVLTSDASGNASWQAGGIPPGMIAMFDAACPSGWTRFAALDGRVPRGATGYGTIGGGDTHQHNVIVGGMTAVYTPGLPTTVGRPGFASVSSENSWPPYLDVIWCKKN